MMSEVEEERVRASLSETTVVHSTINKEISVENPFREGGVISNDADEIVDAFKQGKLSVLSNPPPASELSTASSLNASSLPPTPQPPFTAATTTSPSQHRSDISESVIRDRKNGTSIKEKPGIVEVQHVVVDLKGDSSLVEKVTIPTKKKKGCCTIS